MMVKLGDLCHLFLMVVVSLPLILSTARSQGFLLTGSGSGSSKKNRGELLGRLISNKSSLATGALMLRISCWSIGLLNEREASSSGAGNLGRTSSMMRPSRLSPNNDKRSLMVCLSRPDRETRPCRRRRDLL